MSYTTRFAPSPTGPLHLGHAYSALIAHGRASDMDGQFLLRIEDIDTERSKPEWETLIFDDLHWLGLDWPEPVMRQSARLPAYRAAIGRLIALGICFPCRCTRTDIRAALSAPQENVGPDDLVYPGTCRARPMSDAGPGDAVRLNIAAAMDHLGRDVEFTENGSLHRGRHVFTPSMAVAGIGDIVLARRDIGTSYHLSVVVDDAEQEITEVVRGDDLFSATPVHAVLQDLLGLWHPDYFHHDLIRDETGKRLAKRDDARAISNYCAGGAGPDEIRRMVGF